MNHPTRHDPTYLGLRGTVAGLDPAEAGISPSERLPDIWAVLMEIDMGGAVASVVVVAGGSTSLYLSTGSGVIGTGAHPEVAAASAHLLDGAQAYLRAGWFAPVAEPPLPGPGRTRFNVMTWTGPRTVEAVTDDLAGPDGHPLSALFGAGNDVLTQIRLVQQGEAGSSG